MVFVGVVAVFVFCPRGLLDFVEFICGEFFGAGAFFEPVDNVFYALFVVDVFGESFGFAEAMPIVAAVINAVADADGEGVLAGEAAVDGAVAGFEGSLKDGGIVPVVFDPIRGDDAVLNEPVFEEVQAAFTGFAGTAGGAI